MEILNVNSITALYLPKFINWINLTFYNRTYEG